MTEQASPILIGRAMEAALDQLAGLDEELLIAGDREDDAAEAARQAASALARAIEAADEAEIALAEATTAREQLMERKRVLMEQAGLVQTVDGYKRADSRAYVSPDYR